MTYLFNSLAWLDQNLLNGCLFGSFAQVRQHNVDEGAEEAHLVTLGENRGLGAKGESLIRLGDSQTMFDHI